MSMNFFEFSVIVFHPPDSPLCCGVLASVDPDHRLPPDIPGT
jgi:hypothetical protein